MSLGKPINKFPSRESSITPSISPTITPLLLLVFNSANATTTDGNHNFSIHNCRTPAIDNVC